MKTPFLIITLALFLFAAGFASGFLFRGAPPEKSVEVTQQPRPESAHAPKTLAVRGYHGRRDLRVSTQDHENGDPTLEDEPHRRRGRAQALADLKAALASGDRRAVHEALDDLGRPGEPLSAGEIELLGALLDAVEGEAIELVARALVRNGGVGGFEAVMAFASDPELPVEDRRLALAGVAHAPPGLAEQLLPTIAEFLESGMPRELQHAAAHALGRFMGEQSVDALLGLLEGKPGVSPDVIFDAVAATGRSEDTGALLDLLSRNLDRRSRLGLLRAIGEISGREGNSAVLLDLLRSATDGFSRRVISEAIADSSQRMDLSTLRQALELAAGDGRAQGLIASALARDGGRAGLDVLMDAMSDPNIALDRRTLAYALHEYEGRDGVPLMLDLMRQSRDSEAIEALAFGIARNDNTSSMNELVKMLESGNDQQRMGIAHALREASRGSLSLDRLLDALRVERHPEVGSELARSIGKLYGTEGLRHVTDILNDTTNVERRQALLWGLEESWEHNPARARELYVRLAGVDPVPEIRRQAIDIMQDQNDPSLIPSLEQLFAAESDPEIRERIRDAIRELDLRR